MLLNKIKSSLVPIGILIFFVTMSYNTRGQSRFSMSVDTAPVYERFGYSASVTEGVPFNTWGARLGTSLHVRLAPRWSLSSGLWLEWKGNKRSTIGNYRDFSIHSFKVPLLVHYTLSDKRLSPYFSAGLVWDKFKYSVYSNSKPQESITIFNVVAKPQIKYLLGAGVKYRINEYLAGTLQPTFEYGARSGTRSYQVSLQTQLVFQF